MNRFIDSDFLLEVFKKAPEVYNGKGVLEDYPYHRFSIQEIEGNVMLVGHQYGGWDPDYETNLSPLQDFIQKHLE